VRARQVATTRVGGLSRDARCRVCRATHSRLVARRVDHSVRHGRGAADPERARRRNSGRLQLQLTRLTTLSARLWSSSLALPKIIQYHSSNQRYWYVKTAPTADGSHDLGEPRFNRAAFSFHDASHADALAITVLGCVRHLSAPITAEIDMRSLERHRGNYGSLPLFGSYAHHGPPRYAQVRRRGRRNRCNRAPVNPAAPSLERKNQTQEQPRQ
jgi:hypothetical protein